MINEKVQEGIMEVLELFPEVFNRKYYFLQRGSKCTRSIFYLIMGQSMSDLTNTPTTKRKRLKSKWRSCFRLGSSGLV